MAEENQGGSIAEALMSMDTPAPEPEAPIEETPVEQEVAPVVEEQENSDPVEEHQQDNVEGEEQPNQDSDLEPTAEDDAEKVIEGDAESEDQEQPISFDLPDGSKVEKDELVSGYMRQADYTRKTAELAEQRKQGEQQVQEQNAQVAQVLDALVERYQAFDPRAPYIQALQAAEADGDTELATQLNGHIQALTSEIDRFEKAKQYEDEQKGNKSKQSLEQRKAYERDALFEKMPELRKPEKVKEFQQDTTNALKRFGYSDDEIANMEAPDHRDAMAYYYAEKYFKSLKSTPKVSEKLKGKAVTPKSQPRKAEKNSSKQSAEAKFKRNPNAEGSLAGVLQSYGI